VASFKAIVIEKADGATRAALTDFDEANLMDGDVTVRVEYSTLNYKDALAITGKAPVVRRFPMIGGIDFAGTVEASSHAAWKPGDKVILNGWGCGESHLGAYAGKARVKGDWLVPLPPTMRAREAMAIGTAGYTAMLAALALEGHGLTPERGPIAVAASARWPSQYWPSAALASVRSLAGRRRPIISKAWERPRSSSARNWQDPPSRWPKSVGRVRWMRLARPRWLTCCR
jgi:hypothetical protein